MFLIPSSPPDPIFESRAGRDAQQGPELPNIGRDCFDHSRWGSCIARWRAGGYQFMRIRDIK